MRHRRSMLLATAAACLVGLVLAAGPAVANHLDDHGTIVGGVGSEAEATSYPCPKDTSGRYATTGPVVCVAKRASIWNITWDSYGTGCTYTNTGWSGTCIFDNDMGDHIRVWGTRGIPDTRFTVEWGHPASSSEGEPTPGGGSTPPSGGGSGGSGGYTGPTPPTPPPPSGPGAPPAPGSPDYPDYPDGPGGPGVPVVPGQIGTPDLPQAGTLTIPDLEGPKAGEELTMGDRSARRHDDDGTSWLPIALVVLLLAGGGAAAVMVGRRRPA